MSSDEVEVSGDGRVKVLESLQQHIRFENFVWGCGKATNKGILIDVETSLCSFGAWLLHAYNLDHCEQDNIGRVYAEFPETFQIWSRKDVDSRASQSIGGTLNPAKVQHIMFSGILTSRGRTWLTLYRAGPGNPFSADEAEYGRYTLPKILFDWQVQKSRVMGDFQLAASSSKLSRLTPYQMAIVVEYAKGARTREVAAVLSDKFPPKPGQNREHDSIRREYAEALRKLGIRRDQVIGAILGRAI